MQKKSNNKRISVKAKKKSDTMYIVCTFGKRDYGILELRLLSRCFSVKDNKLTLSSYKLENVGELEKDKVYTTKQDALKALKQFKTKKYDEE